LKKSALGFIYREEKSVERTELVLTEIDHDPRLTREWEESEGRSGGKEGEGGEVFS